MVRFITILAEVELPGPQALTANATHRVNGQISSAFVGVAALALAVVGFLLWDFCRQKTIERRERQRLERFREKRLKETAAENPVL
jgi:hypothetical protein